MPCGLLHTLLYPDASKDELGSAGRVGRGGDMLVRRVLRIRRYEPMGVN
jgi:hypothetical protein